MTLDLFNVDFSEIKDPEPVAPGEYVAEVVAATPGTSKAGHAKIDLQWKIIGSEEDNRRVFSNLSWHPNALQVTKGILIGLGFPTDFSGGIDPEDLVGESAVIVVAVEQSDQINPNTQELYAPRAVVKRVKKLDQANVDVDDLI